MNYAQINGALCLFSAAVLSLICLGMLMGRSERGPVWRCYLRMLLTGTVSYTHLRAHEN